MVAFQELACTAYVEEFVIRSASSVMQRARLNSAALCHEWAPRLGPVGDTSWQRGLTSVQRAPIVTVLPRNRRPS